MILGGQLLREEMKAARGDPEVETVALGLATRRDEDLLIFAMTVFRASDIETLAKATRERHQGSVDDIALIDSIASAATGWRATLDAAEQGCRKGAIIERLVEKLLGQRFGTGTVQVETRVIFTSGETTTPIDVLANPGVRDWEAIECKASFTISSDTAAELGFQIRVSGENADELLVVVASAASQISLLPQLRAVANYQKLGYVASETMFSLAERVPELVPEP
jgi:hypothetical protein